MTIEYDENIIFDDNFTSNDFEISTATTTLIWTIFKDQFDSENMYRIGIEAENIKHSSTQDYSIILEFTDTNKTITIQIPENHGRELGSNIFQDRISVCLFIGEWLSGNINISLVTSGTDIFIKGFAFMKEA